MTSPTALSQVKPINTAGEEQGPKTSDFCSRSDNDPVTSFTQVTSPLAFLYKSVRIGNWLNKGVATGYKFIEPGKSLGRNRAAEGRNTKPPISDWGMDESYGDIFREMQPPPNIRTDSDIQPL
jgi:hypothetical protein